MSDLLRSGIVLGGALIASSFITIGFVCGLRLLIGRLRLLRELRAREFRLWKTLGAPRILDVRPFEWTLLEKECGDGGRVASDEVRTRERAVRELSAATWKWLLRGSLLLVLVVVFGLLLPDREGPPKPGRPSSSPVGSAQP